MKEITYALEELPEVARTILAHFGPQRVYALVGELGAGKTTLVSEMCQQLGVTEPTSSPTFSIVNTYAGATGTVFHLDCYRLESLEEALAAGIEELFMATEGTLFVEWPAIIEPLLPPDVVYLHLGHLPGGHSRQLQPTIGHPLSHEQ